MHKLEIKLKQHTPLIHFQHDQEGATLRASEVKPKLDKFILGKLTPEEKEQGEREGWIKSKNGKTWLDYKMKIEDSYISTWDMTRDTGRTNQRNRPIVDSMPLFFGNMHNRNEIGYVPKKMVFSSVPIIVTFFSINDALLEEIKKNLNTFFILHNFGTRQSKGFGSFMPEATTTPQNIHQNYAKFSWRLPNDVNFGSWDCFFNFFTAIDFFYKALRSGINQNDVYLKSLMYFYATDMDEYWDKRAIRYEFEHFTPDKQSDKGEQANMKDDGDFSKGNARLYRDMLGLSSVQTWKSYDSDIVIKEHITNRTENKIDRFKSPLLIKPIFKNGMFDVYLIPSSIPEAYLNAEFAISSSNKRRNFNMRTPSAFDVDDFLQFITCEELIKFVNKRLDAIINKAEREHRSKAKRIAKTLLSIFNNIEYVEK